MPEGTTAETATTETAPPAGDKAAAEATTTTSALGDDTETLRAEADKWKALARKHEERAKSNATSAKELEEFKRQSMTDTEKLVADARAEGRAEATREQLTGLVEAEVRINAKGRGVDVDALLDGTDRSRFLTDDGLAVDRDAVKAWVDKIAPEKPEGDTPTTTPPGFIDLGQGTRSQDSTALNGDPLLKAVKDKLGTR